MKSFLRMGLHILDPKRDSSITKQRLLLASMLVLVLTMVVFGRLYFLQVVKHDRYRTLSVENRIGLIMCWRAPGVKETTSGYYALKERL